MNKVSSTKVEPEIEMHIPEVRLRWDYTTEQIPVDIDSEETQEMHFYREAIFSSRDTEEKQKEIITTELSKYLTGNELTIKLDELYNKWVTYRDNYKNNII